MIGQSLRLSFSQLKLHPKFQTAWNAYCSVDGIALTQIGGIFEKAVISKKTKIKDQPTKTTDGRTEANAKRKGQKLERSGKYIRTCEVRRTVMAWVAAIGGIKKVRFTTISFPNGTPDDVAKKCLNIFFTRWRKAVPDLSYLWTAERQTNGTIHFHIVQDRYMNIQLLNGFMRASLLKYADQIPNYSREKCNRYNGVDVGEKQYTDLGIVKYLAKYLTKATASGINQPWHRSQSMGELCTKVRFSMDRIKGIMNYAQLATNQPDQKLRVFENDFCLYISAPPIISDLVEFHLEKINRPKWQKRRKPIESHSLVHVVEDPKELQSYETKKEIGLQFHLLDSFPITNYQSRGRRVL